MKKRKGLLVAVLFMAIVGTTACGSSGYDSAPTESKSSVMYDGGDGLYEESYDDYSTETGEATTSVTDNRKLIKTVDLYAETYEFQNLVATVENKVATLGGYIESASIHTRYDDLQYGYFVIRIPVDKLDQFVEEVSGISNITDKDISQDDVTLSYVDLESHKAALEAEETSLLALLENAASIDDIIALQSRLTEVRYQLESMESQLRTMDNLIDYATINLNVDEVETYTPVEEPSMGERISTGFMDSLESVGNGFKNFFIFIVVNSPHLVVWGVIIAVLVIIIRLIVKSSMKKSEERAIERQKALQAYWQQNGVNTNTPQNNPYNVPQNTQCTEGQNGQENGQQ